MDQASTGESLSSDLIRQIGARREEFERAWIAGQSPNIEDQLDGVPLAARPHLLRALLTVEIAHRRNPQGEPLTDQQLADLHPRLAADLGQALQELRRQATVHLGGEFVTIPVRPSSSESEFFADDPKYRTQAPGLPPRPATVHLGAELVTTPFPPSSSESEPSPDYSQYRTQAQGLHIRCPHCSNAVELLASSPYESINCGSCGSAFSLVNRSDLMSEANSPRKLNRFHLLSCLGSGGFGTVWKARDPELDRVVAIKVPRSGRLSAADIEFFFREARATAQLRHPNIVPVHEVGRDGNTLFIVSDFVQGITLAEWLKRHRASPLEVAELCIIVADGLHHAHQQGVVHRDLTPGNILIDESGQPHIMDFGLAKRDIGEVTMTVEGQVLGTPAYMSPEQAGGEGHWTDRRTDIYSLGVIAFQMLTGELPFRGNYQMQIQKRQTEDPPDPRTLNRNISRDLATICIKCLERTPGRRYATAAEVAAEFRRFVNGEPILARPISAPARLARWAKRKPLVASVAALTVFLAIAGPLAALAIDRQRNRLAELVVEKDNLVERLGDEKQRDADRITKLSKQLDLWEGRANPWEFWPPKRNQPLRRELLGDLFNASTANLGNPLQKAQTNGDDEARGDLGLAIMADAVGNTPEAIRHYEQARDRLLALVEQDPKREEFSRALAQCYSDLARLKLSTDRTAAAEYLSNARTINQRLASMHAKTAAYQVEWLEAELDCATLAGFEAGKEHLKQVARIQRSLPANWPSKPADVYELACYLTDREAMLAPPSQVSEP